MSAWNAPWPRGLVLVVACDAGLACAPHTPVTSSKHLSNDPCADLDHAPDGDAALGAGVCFEKRGKQEQAVRAYRQAAAKAPTITRRKAAFVALARLGEAVATPAPGRCAPLPPAWGCAKTYYACAASWGCHGSCEGVHGVALQVFSDEHQASAQDRDSCDAIPLGTELWLRGWRTGSEDQDRSLFSESVTHDPESITLLLSSETWLVSARKACLPGPSDEPFEIHEVNCQLVMADACRGTFGLVCASKTGHRPPIQDVGEVRLDPP